MSNLCRHSPPSPRPRSNRRRRPSLAQPYFCQDPQKRAPRWRRRHGRAACDLLRRQPPLLIPVGVASRLLHRPHLYRLNFLFWICAVWWVQDPLWRPEAFEVADLPAYDFFLLLPACPRQTSPQAQQAIVGVSTGTGVGRTVDDALSSTSHRRLGSFCVNGEAERQRPINGFCDVLVARTNVV